MKQDCVEETVMDEWRIRWCGDDWRYCNGNCGPCLRKYKMSNRTYQQIVEAHETLNKDVPENRLHFYVDVTTMSDSKCVEMFKGTGVVVHKRDGTRWVNGKRVED